jgi:hypothetical protein
MDARLKTPAYKMLGQASGMTDKVLSVFTYELISKYSQRITT